MKLYFGELEVPGVITYSAERNTRNTTVEYNADGEMLIDIVNRKFTLTVYLDGLTSAQLHSIYEQTEAVFFPVTFFTPQFGEIQRSFHLSCEPAETQFIYNGTVYYKAIKLTLEEK